MTGNLDNDLRVTFEYPGTEKEYLKAILVRILSNCFLVPAGFFSYNEETKTIEQDKEFITEFFYGVEEAKGLENWVHYYPHILKSGRTDHFVPKHRVEEEIDELLD